MTTKPDDNTIVECVSCHSVTTRLEANYRNFNTGLCANCGNRLEPVLDELGELIKKLREQHFSAVKQVFEGRIPLGAIYDMRFEAEKEVQAVILQWRNRTVDELKIQLQDWSSRTRSDISPIKYELAQGNYETAKSLVADILQNFDELDKLLGSQPKDTA